MLQSLNSFQTALSVFNSYDGDSNCISASTSSAAKMVFVVSGYIREMQQLLPVNSAYFNIPKLVNVLVFSFVLENEEWRTHSINVSLSETKRNIIVSDRTKEWSSAYGKFDIRLQGLNSNAIYEWQLRFTSPDGGDQCSRLIAIDSSYNALDKYLHGTAGAHYALHSNGYKFCSFSNAIDNFMKGGYKCDDVVTVIINAKERTMSIGRNDEDFGVAFQNINIDHTYHMMVSMAHHIPQQCELISFSIKTT